MTTTWVFRDILVGWPGSAYDSRVFRNSSVCVTVAAKVLGDTHLIGDGGYPLKRYTCTEYCIACFVVVFCYIFQGALQQPTIIHAAPSY